MSSLGFVEAFAKFGAKPENHMWAVSAIAADGALVVSCWAHYFRKSDSGTLCYYDSLSRWTGNERGNRLLRSHLEKAKAENLVVRLLIATAKNPDLVETVDDASKIQKSFHIRKDMIGRLLDFDGDRFAIEFTRP